MVVRDHSHSPPLYLSQYHRTALRQSADQGRGGFIVEELVAKMTDPEQPPKPPVFKSDAIKKRYQHAKSMLLDAFSLPTIER